MIYIVIEDFGLITQSYFTSYKTKKQLIFTFEKMKLANFERFSLENDLNNEWWFIKTNTSQYKYKQYIDWLFEY